ncbi:hypothetical protein [Limnohabitans sp.]|uniref:hypothetical protein n=1 Tax=Limnohabitans sp. TaxID=1907725 RepID=UPI00286F98CB|nr:hypothetical protein [Limnohabitans sp.]
MQHRMYLSPRTPQPFRREERYYVLKISDMRKYLSAEKQEAVHDMAGKINAGRAVDGKAFLQAVVVEHDWPEYERVWQMLETRMTTTRAQPFNPNDDRRFWPIPVSRVKGNNGAPKPLLWRCSCGTKFWVRVNESHCPRCGKRTELTDDQLLAAFNSADTVIDGLHEVAKLVIQPNDASDLAKRVTGLEQMLRQVDAAYHQEREMRQQLEQSSLDIEMALLVNTQTNAEQDKDTDRLINQRDHAHEIIDRLCDVVLGTDRHEWSSAYFFEDAVNEVEEKMAALEKQAPVAWPCVIAQIDFGQNIVTLEMQCSDYKVSAGPHWLSTHLQPKREPLTDEEFTTAIEVEGIPVEDVELVWAIKDLVEAAHGIKGEKHESH